MASSTVSNKEDYLYIYSRTTGQGWAFFSVRILFLLSQSGLGEGLRISLGELNRLQVGDFSYFVWGFTSVIVGDL